MRLRRAVNCWIALLLVVALLIPLWPPSVLAQADAPPSAHGVVTVQADFSLHQADTADFKSKEAGIEVWRQLGNQGVYTAYLGAVFSRPSFTIVDVARRTGAYSGAQLILFNEWNLLKQDQAPSEVFGVTRPDLALEAAIAAHLQESAAFQADAFRQAMAVNSLALQEVERQCQKIYLNVQRTDPGLRNRRAQQIIGQAWAISRLTPEARENLAKLSNSSAKYVSYSDVPLTIQKDVVHGVLT